MQVGYMKDPTYLMKHLGKTEKPNLGESPGHASLTTAQPHVQSAGVNTLCLLVHLKV